MRNRIWPATAAALLLVAGAATPALAGGGLPVLTSLRAGHAEVTIYGDSLQIHTGTNTLTLETTGLEAGQVPQLRLLGPGGQVVTVPLSPLHIVAGPDGGHGDSHGDDSHGGGDDHGGDDHGGDGHGAPAADAVWFRGTAKVGATGLWKAELQVGGEKATDEVKVVENGPSGLFLGATGLAMGGTIIYGAIQRRRPQHGRGK